MTILYESVINGWPLSVGSGFSYIMIIFSSICFVQVFLVDFVINIKNTSQLNFFFVEMKNKGEVVWLFNVIIIIIIIGWKVLQTSIMEWWL